MVFSINTIKDSKNKSLNQEKVNIEESSSWFEQTLDNILAESEIFESIMSSQLVLSEGIVDDISSNISKKVANINFDNILSKIFEWFVAAIERLAKSFLAFLLNFVNKDLQLKAMKHKLSNFRGSVRYNKPYYIYKNLINENSYTSYQVELDNIYDSISSSLSNLANCKSLTQIEIFLNNLRNNTLYSIDEMDLIRGRILGKNSPIQKSDFARELFLFFRTTETPITPSLGLFGKNIDGNRVYEAYTNYFDAKKQENSIRKESIKLKFVSEKEKIRLKTLKVNDYLSENLKFNSELRKIYNDIIKDGCRKIREICEIYSLLFSAKTDALKEYNNMNKQILLLACKEIVKEG